MFQSELLLRVAMAGLAILLYVNHHHLHRHKPFPSGAKKGVEFWVIMAPSLWTLSLILYVTGLEWFNFSLPLPMWLRWTGVGLMASCIPLSHWVYTALGEHFSRKLVLREDHRLVSSGPYKYVRHPMYSLLFLCALSTCLISGNILVMGTTLLVVAVMLVRIRKEETILSERFGEEYAAYRQKTGALLPRGILAS